MRLSDIRTPSVAAAMLFALAASANAEPVYDDPAIAVCELVLKATIPESAVYERTSAAIEGSSAVIGYTTSILNTRPQAAERRCEFVTNDEGKFKLRTHEPARKECNAEIAAFQSNGSPSNRAALQTCKEQMESDLRIMTRELIDREMPLIMTGIYPILASATELRAQ